MLGAKLKSHGTSDEHMSNIKLLVQFEVEVGKKNKGIDKSAHK